MGSIIIGIGLVVGAIGVVFGLIGGQSLAQPSGTALVIVGALGFVGGLLLVALGFVHRALVAIADKLDGVVHVDGDEYFEAEARGPVRHAAPEDLAVATAALARHEPEPVAREPVAREPVARAPEAPAARPAPPPPPPAAPAKESAGGLPSWFRRKRGPEPEQEPEPEFVPESPRPRSTASDDELQPLDLADLLEPPAEPRSPEPKPVESKPLPPLPPRPPEPRRDEPRVPPARPSEPRIAEPKLPEPKFAPPKPPEPRAPEPARAPAVASEEPPVPVADLLDDGPGAPPAFLRTSDLVGEPQLEDTAPSVTVLKAGVIGGMAYKLFSDGSIEADLPDGTLRFGSLQELRDHVSGASQG